MEQTTTTNPQTTKTMCITARCGRTEKQVTFPIPAEWETWMRELSARRDGIGAITAGETFRVEGTKAMTVRIRIYEYGADF